MPETVAVVPLDGRGDLPFADLHREVLFLHAVRALLEVDRLDGHVVVTVDPDQRAAAEAALDRSGLPALVQDAEAWWQALAQPSAGSAGRPGGAPVTLVLHDPLCPLVPGSFVASCLDEAVPGAGVASPRPALVAYRPVTDTIKTVVDGQIADTLDRDRFGIVASPVVFTHHPGLAGPPPTTDLGELATWLRARGEVALRKAPSLGRRVDDPSAVNLLECMDELARSVRET
jgi:2-C-methyl-D-erythritol 4-phosphate cytidylyltransferase